MPLHKRHKHSVLHRVRLRNASDDGEMRDAVVVYAVIRQSSRMESAVGVAVYISQSISQRCCGNTTAFAVQNHDAIAGDCVESAGALRHHHQECNSEWPMRR